MRASGYERPGLHPDGQDRRLVRLAETTSVCKKPLRMGYGNIPLHFGGTPTYRMAPGDFASGTFRNSHLYNELEHPMRFAPLACAVQRVMMGGSSENTQNCNTIGGAQPIGVRPATVNQPSTGSCFRGYEARQFG